MYRWKPLLPTIHGLGSVERLAHPNKRLCILPYRDLQTTLLTLTSLNWNRNNNYILMDRSLN